MYPQDHFQKHKGNGGYQGQPRGEVHSDASRPPRHAHTNPHVTYETWLVHVDLERPPSGPALKHGVEPKAVGLNSIAGRCNCRLPHLLPLPLGPVHGGQQLPHGHQRDEGSCDVVLLVRPSGKEAREVLTKRGGGHRPEGDCIECLTRSSPSTVWAPQAPEGSTTQPAHQETLSLERPRVGG